MCSNLSQSIKMLRRVIFATAPPRKNSREFLRKKEQSHSVQANRFICLRLSVAHCDVVQGPGATELPEFWFFCFKRTARPAQGLINLKALAFNKKWQSGAAAIHCIRALKAQPLN